MIRLAPVLAALALAGCDDTPADPVAGANSAEVAATEAATLDDIRAADAAAAGNAMPDPQD